MRSTVPATGAVTEASIFIASMVAMVSAVATIPSCAAPFHSGVQVTLDADFVLRGACRCVGSMRGPSVHGK
jgi:hypothetical protein